MKQTFRAVGAAAVSATLVGVFALPAYASSTVDQLQRPEIAFAQSFTTVSASDIAVPAQLPTAEEQAVVLAAPAAAAGQTSARYTIDIPAGAGASGMVNAAYAQLGVHQDCTDLVQNSLAAVGIVASRLNGGPDLGVESFLRFGWVVSDGAYAPGDILIWPGHHVALYVGGGMAVHGGFDRRVVGGDGRTVLASAYSEGTPTYVVRVA